MTKNNKYDLILSYYESFFMTEEQKQEYIKKREIILDILKLLFNDWDLAEPLYWLVSSSEVTPNIIDNLIKIFESSFKDAEDETKREKINTALNSLKSLKQKEELELNSDRNDINVFMENAFI